MFATMELVTEVVVADADRGASFREGQLVTSVVAYNNKKYIFYK